MYFEEYKWMRKPTPVTIKLIVEFSASRLNFTDRVGRALGVLRDSHSHAVQLKRTACSSCPCAVRSMKKAVTSAMKAPPTALSAISVTP